MPFMMNLIPPLNGYSLRSLSKIFFVILFFGNGFAHTEDSCPTPSGPPTWRGKLRVKTLKTFDRFLNWTFGKKYKTYVLATPEQECRIDLAVPEMKEFEGLYGYFSAQEPMVAKMTSGEEAFTAISCLLKTLYEKGGNTEYLEIAVSEVLTKVLACHDLACQQTVMIPMQIGGRFSLEPFVVDRIFNLWHGMPAFGLVPEREGVNSLLLFRGTEFSLVSRRGWASIMSDLDMSGPGFSVFQRSENGIAQWLKEVHAKGKPARVMGFSLGGALAAYTFIYENRWLAEHGSLSIGSPGIKEKPLAQWELLPQERKLGFVSLINRGEIVPKVGKLFGNAYLLSTPETHRPLAAHTLLMTAQPFFFKSKIDVELENGSR
jgi:hypothetical protein